MILGRHIKVSCVFSILSRMGPKTQHFGMTAENLYFRPTYPLVENTDSRPTENQNFIVGKMAH
jgi:hypothetical protein